MPPPSVPKRSISMVRAPVRAAAIAAVQPAWPPPDNQHIYFGDHRNGFADLDHVTHLSPLSTEAYLAGRSSNARLRFQSILMPPLTATISPVMNEASSEQRNDTTRAISSGAPMRSRGMFWRSRSRLSGVLIRSWIGV